jgi:hypothetical protein
MEHGEIKLQIDNLGVEELAKYQEILFALISCGGLSGVKNGRTVIHFDQDGVFKGIQLDYWPWSRRKVDRPPN